MGTARTEGGAPTPQTLTTNSHHKLSGMQRAALRRTTLQIAPMFRPTILSELDLGNIDEKFAKATPTESPCSSLTNTEGAKVEE